MTLTPSELQETLDAFERHGRNQTATANALGIRRSTLQARLARATSKGIGSHFVHVPATDAGLEVAGTSTLYREAGANGERVLQWVKTGRLGCSDGFWNRLKEEFGEPVDKGPVISSAFDVAELVNIFPIADLHFGMYAWGEETGDDYDTGIAAYVLTQAMDKLLARVPTADVGVLLNLGDFYHSDNDENLTRKSGNKLDVDTRWARVQRDGIKLMRRITERAKEKHRVIVVKNIAGNHDPYGSIALTNALACAYEHDERVCVDTSPSPVWCTTFGRTLVSAAHGDGVKPRDLPANIAANYPAQWGETEWRYGYLGHIHQLNRKRQDDAFEGGGMEVEVFRTLAPKDSFAAHKGYVARRSLVAITHHHVEGEVDRKTVNVRSRQARGTDG